MESTYSQNGEDIDSKQFGLCYKLHIDLNQHAQSFIIIQQMIWHDSQLASTTFPPLLQGKSAIGHHGDGSSLLFLPASLPLVHPWLQPFPSQHSFNLS